MERSHWKNESSIQTLNNTPNFYNFGNIVIWGTGKYASRLMEEISYFEDKLPNECIKVKQNIICFVDRNANRWGKIFYDKEIRNPLDITWIDGKFLCVIAIKEHQEVFRFLLEKCGLCASINIVYIDEFLRLLHWELTAFYSRNPEKFEASSIKEKIYIASIVEMLYKTNKNIFDIYNYCDNVTCAEITAAMRFLFLDTISIISKRFINIKNKQQRKVIKTIGILLYQYGGGGAERVVSHLISLYHKMKYNVILLTFTEPRDTDYALSDGIVRHVISNEFSTNPDLYFKDMENAISKYSIDLLCLHTPYEGAFVFYTAILAKLIGIYCIAENHTSFVNFVRQRNGLRNHDKIYGILDHLVVLSRTDEVFWSTLGCSCTYIPNPCVDISVNQKKARGRNTILWVGRLDHKYKRILDIVPIMREVIRYLPRVKLLVVGRRESKNDFELLKRRIQGNGLDNNIVLCGEQKDVSRYYHEADVLLMTSPGEGFPMVLSEAMSCSLPVVMYDLPYLEIVRNGGGIFSVAQSDVNEAAQKIVSLFSNDALYEKASSEARRNIEYFLKYDLAVAWKKVFQEIETGNLKSGVRENREMALIEKLLSV